MYKEKYLKYKTKYLELKNQLGGNSNIIQDGGGGSVMTALFGKSSGDIKKEEARQKEEKEARQKEEKETKIRVNINLPDKTDTQALLEEGKLLMHEHIRTNKESLTAHTIIFPTEIFYKNNPIEYATKENDIYYKDSDMKYTNDAFIILQKSIKHNDISNWDNMTTDVFIGLLINYIKNQIFVIQWEPFYSYKKPTVCRYQFREIKETITRLKDQHVIYGHHNKFKNDRVLFNEYIEMLIECLTESIRFLSEHIPYNEMKTFIEEQIEELKKLNMKPWPVNA
jgi:hypothetical protein